MGRSYPRSTRGSNDMCRPVEPAELAPPRLDGLGSSNATPLGLMIADTTNWFLGEIR